MDKKYTLGDLKAKLPDYLKDKGININKGFRCLSPDHNDQNPSMHYSKKLEIVKCFGCGKSYNIFGLVGIEYGLKSFKDQIQKVCDLYGYDINEVDLTKGNIRSQRIGAISRNQTVSSFQDISERKTDYTNYFRYCLYNALETDYLKKRGLSCKTISRNYVGYDPEQKIIVISTSKYSYTSRNIDETEKGYRYRKVGSNQIYLYDKIKDLNQNGLKPPIFIVEGEFDALSMIEAGGNAIALGSVANCHKLIEKLEVDQYSNLFLIALDNDEAGKKASADLSKEFETIGINHKTIDIYGDCKDANELLLKDRNQLKKAISFYLEEDATQVLNQKQLLMRKTLMQRKGV